MNYFPLLQKQKEIKSSLSRRLRIAAVLNDVCPLDYVESSFTPSRSRI